MKKIRLLGKILLFIWANSFALLMAIFFSFTSFFPLAGLCRMLLTAKGLFETLFSILIFIVLGGCILYLLGAFYYVWFLFNKKALKGV